MIGFDGKNDGNVGFEGERTVRKIGDADDRRVRGAGLLQQLDDLDASSAAERGR